MDNYTFNSLGELTKLAKSKNITDWQELTSYIQRLPYGRNSNRYDVSLVLKENKGSCSSKHAFLKVIADENSIPNIQLMLGIYKMNHTNTKIGTTITDADLEYIPEAHCYLKINGRRIDITSENASFKKIENALLSEFEINAKDISEFKVTYHQNVIKKWIQKENIHKSFDEVWWIREQCITHLSKK